MKAYLSSEFRSVAALLFIFAATQPAHAQQARSPETRLTFASGLQIPGIPPAASFSAFSGSDPLAAAASSTATASAASPVSAASPASAASPVSTASALAPAVATVAAAAKVASRSFLDRQLEFPRVRRAYAVKSARVASLFTKSGVGPPAEVLFRVFKREQILEVWGRGKDTAEFVLLNRYPVCQVSGRLGPKRRQGDRQIPEGFYSIDIFNPQSSYHLSMRVDYPNAVDRSRGVRGPLGGDIYIHGGCATIGCVPVTDEYIEELYLIAVQARTAGQTRIPVQIFPTRLDAAGMQWLAATYGSDFVDYPFWENLREGYEAFERTRTPPRIEVVGGRYTFPAESSPAVAASPASTATSPAAGPTGS